MQTELFTIVLNVIFSDDKMMNIDGFIWIPDPDSNEGFYTKPLSGKSPLLLDEKFYEGHQERALTDNTSVVSSQSDVFVIDIRHIIRKSVYGIDEWARTKPRAHDILIDTVCSHGTEQCENLHHWLAISLPYYDEGIYTDFPLGTWWQCDGTNGMSDIKLNVIAKPNSFKYRVRHNCFTFIGNYYMQSNLIFRQNAILGSKNDLVVCDIKGDVNEVKHGFIGCTQRVFIPAYNTTEPLDLEVIKSDTRYFNNFRFRYPISNNIARDGYKMLYCADDNIMLNFRAEANIRTANIGEVFTNYARNTGL